MALTSQQRIDRIEKRLSELELWIDRATVALADWTFNGKPLPPGASWPTRQGVATVAHPAVRVPDDWPLDEVRLALDLGGEGLVRLSYADGDGEAFGLDPNHRRFPLKGRAFTVAAECVARLPFGVPNRDARLGHSRLVWTDVTVAEYVLLLRQAAETARILDQHEAVSPLLSAAEDSLRKLDWPTATDTYVARVAPGAEMQLVWELPADLDRQPAGLADNQRQSVSAANAHLVRALRALQARYPQTGVLALSGHAHIDLAWLWPLAETRRKANRTFHTMVGLMDRNPGFLFNQSTAQLYAFLEEDDPALFKRIVEKVAAGRWEPIGAMWVEPDTNIPTGESLVRQLLYGQRYFERAFGRRHKVCWLPDCFGFSPALPQLLRLAGVDSFFTIKVNWSETNDMPFDLFWWEGLDGSRVLSHTFKNPVGGYNGETSPRAVVETWRNYRGKHRHPESLFAFGYGDGGGGPTQEMLDRQRQLADFPVVPALRPTVVADWYTQVHTTVEAGADLPVWVGEIYLELHRGTLTTQGRTKYLHRRAERALIAAEVLASMATMLGAPFARSLEDQWRLILRNEFHDILPGSSICEVYQLAESDLGSVVTAGEEVADRHMAAIADRIVPPGDRPGVLVVNPDLSDRPLRLEADFELPGGQPIAGGQVLAGDATVSGLTAMVITGAAAPPALEIEERRIENAFLRVELDKDGTCASVYDKRTGREILADRGNQIWIYVDKPRNWDAWDVEEGYWHQGTELATSAAPEVVEAGPHRAAIRVSRRYRDSEIVQTIRLWANSARLEFRTDIDWHDRRTMLRARFPLAIRADHATFECAHGVIRRPTHRNTSWDEARFEVAAHRFADLSEHGYGVALLNDGKYGHHAFGNELGINLLRSPVFPDPVADEGRQGFTYALYPHSGDWLSGGVLAEAEDLNRPMSCRPVRASGEAEWTAARIDGIDLGLSAFKVAEDGGALILRTYEPAGARGRTTLTLADGWKVAGEVNLLEDLTGRPDFEFLPFKVHGWKVEKDGS